jgi:hypothetical protein
VHIHAEEALRPDQREALRAVTAVLGDAVDRLTALAAVS